MSDANSIEPLSFYIVKIYSISNIIYLYFNDVFRHNCIFLLLVSESESEEDREKKEKKNRMKEEYYFAIQEEGKGTFPVFFTKKIINR